MPVYLIPVTDAIGTDFPVDIAVPTGGGDLARFLSRIGIRHLAFDAPARVSCTLVILEELAFELPGLAGTELAFASGGEGLTELSFALSFLDPFSLGIGPVPIELRLSRDLVKPAERDGDAWVVPDDASRRATIGISPTLTITGDGRFDVADLTDIVLSPMAIADTGMVLEIPTVQLILDEGGSRPEGMAPGDRGVYIPRASLHFPPDVDIAAVTLEKCSIGSGGFSGKVRAEFLLEWDAERGRFSERSDMVGTLGGIQIGLRLIELGFEQNAFEDSKLQGEVFLPFFDKRLGVDVGFTLDGDFAVGLTGAGDGTQGNDGLLTVEKEGLLALTVKSFGVTKEDDLVSVILSGSLKPLLGGLDWPKIDVESLAIRSDGSVDVEGGWLNVPRQYCLDFHGFKIDIRELGFGNEDDGARQWLGVSGGITLVEGIPVSASVDGLKFSWPTAGGDVAVSLRGIDVHLEIPNVLVLDGSVSYEKLDGTGPQGLEGDLFKGHVSVDLKAVKLRIGADLMIGKLRAPDGDELTVVYVSANVKLPTAIPLGPTGLGIWELQGLFGMHAGPALNEEQSWYEWYKEPRGGDANAYSITTVDKWRPAQGEYAFGAGLRLGTQPDDGFSVNLGAMVVVLIPGPVILIEGSANVLKDMPGTRKQEGAFHALAVIDGRAGFFQINIDVQYDIEGLLTIAGGMEAFFDFHDPNAWYVYLGRDTPESKRIRAQILSLFAVDTYLMIDPRMLATGASGGFNLRETYGPLEIAFVLKLGYDAKIFWKPFQAEGGIFLEGDIAVKVFGIGLQLFLKLLLEVKAPTPFWVHGLAAIRLQLPLLPVIEAEVEFTWEEPIPPEPVVPYLKRVGLVHHKLANVGWELEGALADAPVVPVDSRPVLSFARPLHGRSGRVGEGGWFEPFVHDAIDEWRFVYHCTAVELVADPGGAEERVVKRFPADGTDLDPTVTPFDSGPDTLLPSRDAQEPTWQLWKHGAWDRMPGSLLESLPDSQPPCQALRPRCLRWSGEADHELPRRFTKEGARLTVPLAVAAPWVLDGELHFFEITVRFPAPVSYARILLAAPVEDLSVTAYSSGTEVPIDQGWEVLEGSIRPEGAPFDTLHLLSRGVLSGFRARIAELCYLVASDAEGDARDADPDASRTGHASGGAPVLEPDTRYALRITTTTELRRDNRSISITPTTVERFFRTAAGPGLPTGGDAEWKAGPLGELGTYVARTLPDNGARDVYRGYDLRVLFNEPYVPQMYPSGLRLEVVPMDGAPADGVDGLWRFGRLPLSPEGLWTYESAERLGGCGGDPRSGGSTPELYRAAPDDLRARRRYRVDVRADAAPEPLLGFDLTTSRYERVEDHLSSGVDTETGRQRVRSLPAGPELGVDLTALRAARAALESARSSLASVLGTGSVADVGAAHAAALARAQELDDASHAAFEALDAQLGTRLAAVGRARWALPPVVELVHVPGELHAGCLLLESPEPIPWMRLSAALAVGGAPVSLLPIWSADRTRAFLLAADRPGLPRGEHELSFRLDATEHPELVELTVDGTPVVETARLSYALG